MRNIFKDKIIVCKFKDNLSKTLKKLLKTNFKDSEQKFIVPVYLEEACNDIISLSILRAMYLSQLNKCTVIVIEAGLHLDCVFNLPGPLSGMFKNFKFNSENKAVLANKIEKYAYDTNENGSILSLVAMYNSIKKTHDSRATLLKNMVICDKNSNIVFNKSICLKGNIVIWDGDKYVNYYNIFKPKGYTKSLSAMNSGEFNVASGNSYLVNTFNEFLIENYINK